MSRTGDEMISNLATALNVDFLKVASVNENVIEETPADPEKELDPKYAFTAEIIDGLSKLATKFDELDADDASSAVDDALAIIINNIKQNK